MSGARDTRRLLWAAVASAALHALIFAIVLGVIRIPWPLDEQLDQIADVSAAAADAGRADVAPSPIDPTDPSDAEQSDDLDRPIETPPRPSYDAVQRMTVMRMRLRLDPIPPERDEPEVAEIEEPPVEVVEEPPVEEPPVEEPPVEEARPSPQFAAAPGLETPPQADLVPTIAAPPEDAPIAPTLISPAAPAAPVLTAVAPDSAPDIAVSAPPPPPPVEEPEIEEPPVEEPPADDDAEDPPAQPAVSDLSPELSSRPVRRPPPPERPEPEDAPPAADDPSQDPSPDFLQSLESAVEGSGSGPGVEGGTGVADLGPRLTQGELRGLSLSIQRCWVRPARPDPELAMQVRVELSRDGALSAEPQVVGPSGALSAAQRVAARNAIQAVRDCAPFTQLDPAKYGRWRVLVVTFDPAADISLFDVR